MNALSMGKSAIKWSEGYIKCTHKKIIMCDSLPYISAWDTCILRELKERFI